MQGTMKSKRGWTDKTVKAKTRSKKQRIVEMEDELLLSLESESCLRPFDQLPIEILAKILSYLPISKLFQPSLVCHGWNQCAKRCRKIIDTDTFVRNPDSAMVNISKTCPDLEVLYLSRLTITNKDLGLIGQFHLLKKLFLPLESDVTQRGMRALGRLELLEELIITNMHGTSALNSRGLDFLPSLKRLKFLGILWACKLGDAALEKISCVTSLERLVLTSFYRVSDSGMRHLSKLTSLTSLWLLDIGGITSDSITSISSLKSLEHLAIFNSINFGDVQLEQLSKMSSLQTLEIERCSEVSESGISALQNLKNLKILTFQGLKLKSNQSLLTLTSVNTSLQVVCRDASCRVMSSVFLLNRAECMASLMRTLKSKTLLL
eukprot:TRINITY_DN11222_c0_g1_i1.p1 TRINITY_DN11222_c0_g1~~TRINITY_DN11222_c0_g1_i1.p1  ORF type:complete len:378 (-),score=85.77 TRINITY_DN11222_c0_g1_i1:24-1157(-)